MKGCAHNPSGVLGDPGVNGMGKLALEVDPVLSSANLSLPVTVLLWAFGSNFILVFR